MIDEGFGSQDTRGLDMVVETINSIKGDFELVIVISHIDELKDQFGAHRRGEAARRIAHRGGVVDGRRKTEEGR